MLENLKKFNIILASNSPRRKHLLAELGVDYVVRTLPDVDESYPDNLRAEAIPEYISRTKAGAYQHLMQPDELVITRPTPLCGWMKRYWANRPMPKRLARCFARYRAERTKCLRA